MIDLKILDEYDWKCAFQEASNDVRVCPPGSKIDTTAFYRADVKKIIAIIEGENDELDWLIVVELKDDRYGFVTAGCDYTGWDCQAGAHSFVAETLKDLKKFGISREEGLRLGLDNCGA